eukprot:CAMPEP_0179069634 /NCGR_PEP_ID=MMETSP0796-20121207/30608_1 /TAXON_ID=73915 /ORGANISM="Pyrodinium bahamense, Strain pbaha01" /LENGTH=97 /DNA_ID=CAMNT_0020766705 /DNA_START=133 /DNA_END=421 /DNA_ORIENTATION=+
MPHRGGAERARPSDDRSQHRARVEAGLPHRPNELARAAEGGARAGARSGGHQAEPRVALSTGRLLHGLEGQGGRLGREVKVHVEQVEESRAKDPAWP